jgi:rhodanese-related sulfurtransferase
MPSSLTSPFSFAASSRTAPGGRSARGISAAHLPRAIDAGFIVLDVRTQEQRNAQGTLPGALAIELEALEARVDPAGPQRLSLAESHDVPWLIVCADGERSAVAAWQLRAGGLRRSAHVLGGYRAVKEMGLAGAGFGARHVTRELATVAAH